MTILDAIRTAASDHAVYFLVTAYFESLHHFHRSLGVPRRVIDLPVRGFSDLTERLEALRIDTGVRLKPAPGPSEALSILECAVARLTELGDGCAHTYGGFQCARKAGPLATLHGKSDIPHCVRSV